MYATTTSGHREHVTKNKEKKVIQAISINTTFCRLIQTTTTTTETWVGLKYSDAESVCTTSETSVKDGVTRQYLGAAKITVGVGTASQWVTVFDCWGTKVTSQLSRMGDTNCYMVTRTTVEMTVTNNGGDLDLL